jgi:Holliday junction resolvase
MAGKTAPFVDIFYSRQSEYLCLDVKAKVQETKIYILALNRNKIGGIGN